MDHAELTVTDGVLLAHGLVARLAEQAGARVLFIKGPTAVAAGARPARPSSDVDVLVDPAAFDRLCLAIEAAGWFRRFVPLPVHRAADLAFDHSGHFIREGWPCDLDVHFLFPGFLAEPQVVFEALWERRTTTVVAGRSVTTPDVLGHALVVALHALRDVGRPWSREDLDHLENTLGSTLDDGGREALGRLAAATGSDQSARALLERVGVALPPPPREQSPALAAWRVRQEFGTVSGSLWLVELRRARWRERPRILLHAVVPPREQLLSAHLAPAASRREIARLHAARWGRGVRALPRAMTILRKVRRSADG
ncbi:nucleotidyltransferase family protein [Nostocoides sp. HKS02]|uniref:nucleotidyltransferase family protein n=1 Tax=Nostocoides sp. HKS02 TaxID=1813880 RepID=UPI0018A82E88|nr:nucleotidyltransferase family protein [Tetrasphaera sp. HKS02]